MAEKIRPVSYTIYFLLDVGSRQRSGAHGFTLHHIDVMAHHALKEKLQRLGLNADHRSD